VHSGLRVSERMEQAIAATTRRRGHQHHPRHTTRRRLDASSRGPAQCGPAGATVKDTSSVSDGTSLVRIADTVDNRVDAVEACATVPRTMLGTRWPMRVHEREAKGSRNQDDEPVCRDEIQRRLAQCSLDRPAAGANQGAERDKETAEPTNKEKRPPRGSPRGRNSEGGDAPSKNGGSPEPEHAVARARGDGNSDDESTNVEEDPELAELAKLRCPSERAEVQAEREARRRKRCADYPGLAFGCSIFSSDTMMKFSLIKNELQNIMGNQLKRVSIARARARASLSRMTSRAADKRPPRSRRNRVQGRRTARP